MQFNRRPRYYRNVTFDLFKEILKLSAGARFVRKRALNHYVLACLAQRELGGSATEIWDWGPVQVARYRSGEKDLMVRLNHVFLIYEVQLCDDCADLQLAVGVQIRNVTYNEAV